MRELDIVAWYVLEEYLDDGVIAQREYYFRTEWDANEFLARSRMAWAEHNEVNPYGLHRFDVFPLSVIFEDKPCSHPDMALARKYNLKKKW